MSKEICGERRGESYTGKEERLQLAVPGSGERLVNSRILKALESDSRAVRGGSTISFRRIGASYALTPSDVETSNFTVMYAPSVMATRGGPRPRANRELLGFNRERPTVIELNYIGPADRELLKRIGDDNSFITKADFRTDQKDIDTCKHEESDEAARKFADLPTLVETRPDKESAENNSDTRKKKVGLRAVRFGVVHTSILTHLAAGSIKAVS